MAASIKLAAAVFAFAFFAAVSDVSAQDKPLFVDYKGVSIGMPMADARQKLGKATEQTDAEDYWEFAKDETVRVLYGPDKMVRAISISYDASQATAPTAMSVLGSEIPAKADGSMSKMVEYKKAGFWISYVRTAGATPLVFVTLQKMEKR
jgi:ABC-type microcin C transport system permease subunit YejE